jgi:hypothetical protein
MATSPTLEVGKSQECKENVIFYMQHLGEKELKVLEKLANELAENYSESYWKFERD